VFYPARRISAAATSSSSLATPTMHSSPAPHGPKEHRQITWSHLPGGGAGTNNGSSSGHRHDRGASCPRPGSAQHRTDGTPEPPHMSTRSFGELSIGSDGLCAARAGLRAVPTPTSTCSRSRLTADGGRVSGAGNVFTPRAGLRSAGGTPSHAATGGTSSSSSDSSSPDLHPAAKKQCTPTTPRGGGGEDGGSDDDDVAASEGDAREVDALVALFRTSARTRDVHHS